MSKIAERLAVHMALANGYPSLISRLKKDDATRFLSTQDDRNLIRKLKQALSQKGQSFEQQVMPYAYVVAIYLKGRKDILQIAKGLQAGDNYPWYNSVVEFLLLQANTSNNFSVGLARSTSSSPMHNQPSSWKVS